MDLCLKLNTKTIQQVDLTSKVAQDVCLVLLCFQLLSKKPHEFHYKSD